MSDVQLHPDEFGQLNSNTAAASPTYATFAVAPSMDLEPGSGPDADSLDTDMIKVASPHYDDFQFSPFPGPHGDAGAMVMLFDDAAMNVFDSASRTSSIPPSTLTDSTAQAAVETAPVNDSDQMSHFVEPPAPKRKPRAAGSAKSAARETQAAKATGESMSSKVQQAGADNVASDDDSQNDSEPDRGASLLEEPMSDEFGLALNDSASLELRGQRSSGTGGGGGGGGGKDERSGGGNDVVPAWSELKTKAGKERKRLPLACIACRRKKIRCSGEKPACKHCLRSRTPCVYKVTARKAAPRTDYMAMLDKRLKRMEDRIIKIIPKAEQDAPVMASVVRAVVKPAIPGSSTTPGSANGTGAAGPAGSAAGTRGPSNKKRVADEAFGPELDHWARIGSKGRSGSARPHNILLQQESEENKLFQEGAEALPSRDLQEHLAEVFFEHIYGQAYHLLHRPSYMRKLRYVDHTFTGSPPLLTVSSKLRPSASNVVLT